MSCHHIGAELIAHAESGDDRVEEYGRLGYLGLAEILISSVEHDVSDAKAKDVIGLFE